MNRNFKKFTYGVFYLAIFFLIGWGVYGAFSKEPPTCSDGRQNQGEFGIDCGGPCVSCEILKLEPIRAAAAVKIFSLSGGQTVLLGEVLNPNASYNASKFSYRFLLYDRSGAPIATRVAEESIYALQRKFIYGADVPGNLENIARAELEILNPEWVEAKNFLKPDLGSPENITTEVLSEGLKVSGLVSNRSPVKVRQLKIIAVLFDKIGQEIFASETIITDLEGFEEKSFAIYFPGDETLMKNADLGATQVFLSPSFSY